MSEAIAHTDGAEARPGVFITFEGTDGVGKSTQVALLAQRLEAQGFEVVCLHEPGGTELGERIRALLLEPGEAQIAPLSELFLFEAARAQLVEELIFPALSRGAVVLSDRFFDSTLAYQGYGRGIDVSTVERLNDLACSGLVPDRTIFLDLDPSIALARAQALSSDGEGDRMEAAGVSFQQRVEAGFEKICSSEGGRVRRVDASGDVEEVAARIYDAIADLIEGPSSVSKAGCA